MMQLIVSQKCVYAQLPRRGLQPAQRFRVLAVSVLLRALVCCLGLLPVYGISPCCAAQTLHVLWPCQPRIVLYPDVISAQEAQHLIALAQGRLSRSTVIHSSTQAGTVDEVRTSQTAFLDKAQDPVVAALEERVARLLGCTVAHLEPLQVVHYTEGQQYKPHHDYFDAAYLASTDGNQRRHTLLIYLNDVPWESGGQTVFPHLGLGLQPRLGLGLYFQNADPLTGVDPQTLHAAMPLQPGAEKWACNVWVRQGPWVPPDAASQAQDDSVPPAPFQPLPITAY
jgi:prolyl 4-hydroxylase